MDEESKKPGNNNTSRKKDQYTIVLEDLRSQFKVFGESLSGFRKETRERLDKIEKNLEVTLEYLFRIDDEILDIKKKLENMEKNDAGCDNAEFGMLKTKIFEMEKEMKKIIAWKKEQQKLACT